MLHKILQALLTVSVFVASLISDLNNLIQAICVKKIY